MPIKERLILSANAVPRRGGQGMNLYHMIEGLGGIFELSVFCQGGEKSVPTQHVTPSRWSETIGRIPVVRQLRDWQALLNEVHFDRTVSRRLGSADFFQGTTGQCLESLRTARVKGCFTILDVVTFHQEHYYQQMAAECAKFGVRPTHHPIQRQRTLEEYKRADVIRVMSEPARRTFLERGVSEERVFAAPPPFDLAQFPQADFGGDKFTISFVGLLEPAKGFHYLIDAFRKLNRPSAELLLWGNTGARPMARYLGEEIAACPAIQLRPYSVSQIGYEKSYGASSVLVHPSLADGFGYVVGEAMACGIPVITTTTTGASQCIVDGVNGYVVPPRDADAICEKLEYLMDHPSRVREMGRAARETMAGLTIGHFRQCYQRGLAAAHKSTAELIPECPTLPQ